MTNIDNMLVATPVAMQNLSQEAVTKAADILRQFRFLPHSMVTVNMQSAEARDSDAVSLPYFECTLAQFYAWGEERNRFAIEWICNAYADGCGLAADFFDNDDVSYMLFVEDEDMEAQTPQDETIRDQQLRLKRAQQGIVME
jgi:hypothetical protein